MHARGCLRACARAAPHIRAGWNRRGVCQEGTQGLGCRPAAACAGQPCRAGRRRGGPSGGGRGLPAAPQPRASAADGSLALPGLHKKSLELAVAKRRRATKAPRQPSAAVPPAELIFPMTKCRDRGFPWDKGGYGEAQNNDHICASQPTQPCSEVYSVWGPSDPQRG